MNENYADYNITVSLEKIMADNYAYFYVYATSEGEVMNEIFISSDRYQFEVLVLANEDFTILGLDTDTI